MNTSVETQNHRGQMDQQNERGFVSPPANISANGDEYLVELEMPGVDRTGLEITVEDGELTIIGRRRAETPEGELCYCESSRADFRRVFEIGPDVDTSRINAQIDQGVLKLHLPKSERAKPRRIEIAG
jgi:HSP20 family protein